MILYERRSLVYETCNNCPIVISYSEVLKNNVEGLKKEDIKFINKNQECIKKIYLIGFTNAKECYER